jgi:hypothetical protein
MSVTLPKKVGHTLKPFMTVAGDGDWRIIANFSSRQLKLLELLMTMLDISSSSLGWNRKPLSASSNNVGFI